jgi:trk system potassium uptake protein TrkH
LATVTLLLLMFSGASAGSTGGGIKIVRHLLLFRLVKRELEQTVHREAIVPIRVNKRVVDEKALRSTIVFVLLYLLVFAVGALALVADARRAGERLSAFDAFGAAAACLGNVGPAFGFAGPYGSFAPFSDLSTWICTVLMWLGRVEIIPVAVILTRAYWRS